MFAEHERLIYSYRGADGSPVKADPLVLQRKLVQAAGGDLHGVAEAARAVPPELPGATAEQAQASVAARMSALDAQERLVAVVRAAFDFPPLDPKTGEGVLESHCLATWNDFQEWLAGNASRAG